MHLLLELWFKEHHLSLIFISYLIQSRPWFQFSCAALLKDTQLTDKSHHFNIHSFTTVTHRCLSYSIRPLRVNCKTHKHFYSWVCFVDLSPWSGTCFVWRCFILHIQSFLFIVLFTQTIFHQKLFNSACAIPVLTFSQKYTETKMSEQLTTTNWVHKAEKPAHICLFLINTA